jgi:hypothetical protein
MSELRRLAGRAAALVRERAVEGAREARRAAAARATAAWTHRPPAPRATAIALAAAVALAGAWSVVAQARLAGKLPSPLDWAAARALVERDARSGDAAAVSPPWAERAREVLPSFVPVLAQARFAGEDLVGVRRVWLVSLPDVPWSRWEAEIDLAERSARAETPARLGALEITRYDLADPTLPLAFLPDRLGHAAVTLGGLPCQAEGAGRFRCGEGAVEVAREVRDVGGVARPCLTASAAASLDAPLAVAFPPMRIGRTLHGHSGPTDLGPPAGPAPVRLAVLLDGEEVGAAELPGAAWTPFRVDMARSAGQVRTLSLVLTSPGRLALCLDALVLP